MKAIKIVALICALCLLGANRVEAEEECKSLLGATPERLVSYLDKTSPNDRNGECVSYAIVRLGRERYEPAMPALAKWLWYRRPLTAEEKHGVKDHPRTIDNMYPAVGALDEFGKKSLPVVLETIKSPSSSSAPRDSAVAVWMFVYSDRPPKGVALLRQEARGTADPAMRQNLRWALEKASTWCGPKEKARCTAAAAMKEQP
jgi:hypothetical protein